MARLLLADDSVTIHRVIEMTFAGEDISVTAVSDGEQAIARIAEERPDIVLASIATPKRNGYDVSAFVKSRPDLSSIPVLLMAGAFEPVDQARAEQVKCDGVLVKPLDPQQVIARVRELIGGARGTPAQATSGVPRPVERLTTPLKLVEPRRQMPAAPAALAPEPAPKAAAAPPPAPVHPARQQAQAPVQARSAAAPPSPPPDRAPEPPPAFEGEDTVAEGLDDALDDYFDRLDAAFANLSSTPAEDALAPKSSRAARAAAARSKAEHDEAEDHKPVPTIDSLLGLREAPKAAPDPLDMPLHPPARPVRHEAFGAEVPVAPPVEEPPAPAPPAPSEPPKPVEPPAPSEPPAPAEPPRIEPPKPLDVQMPSDALPPADIVRPVVPPAPATPVEDAAVAEARHSIADAFNALLAAELGERTPMPVQFRPAAVEPKITDELVEAVTRRVIERLAPDVVRKVVVDVVSELAERLIREEIARIREKR